MKISTFGAYLYVPSVTFAIWLALSTKFSRPGFEPRKRVPKTGCLIQCLTAVPDAKLSTEKKRGTYPPAPNELRRKWYIKKKNNSNEI